MPLYVERRPVAACTVSCRSYQRRPIHGGDIGATVPSISVRQNRRGCHPIRPYPLPVVQSFIHGCIHAQSIARRIHDDILSRHHISEYGNGDSTEHTVMHTVDGVEHITSTVAASAVDFNLIAKCHVLNCRRRILRLSLKHVLDM